MEAGRGLFHQNKDFIFHIHGSFILRLWREQVKILIKKRNGRIKSYHKFMHVLKVYMNTSRISKPVDSLNLKFCKGKRGFGEQKQKRCIYLFAIFPLKYTHILLSASVHASTLCLHSRSIKLTTTSCVQY